MRINQWIGYTEALGELHKSCLHDGRKENLNGGGSRDRGKEEEEAADRVNFVKVFICKGEQRNGMAPGGRGGSKW